jgi:hypothetical protein
VLYEAARQRRNALNTEHTAPVRMKKQKGLGS